MIVKEPKFRKQVNSKQQVLLYLCFKFRFISLDVVAEHLGKNRSTVYESLVVLGQQGYIAKQYDPSFKLRHRPASYTLAPKGINYLMKTGQCDEQHLKNFYKNRKAPEELIDRHLLIYKAFIAFKRRYGEHYGVLTRYELSRELFSEAMPDLYLEPRGNTSDKPEYVVDIIEAGTFSWLLRKRIQGHEQNDYEWEYKYPNVMLIAGNVNTERRLFKMTWENWNDFAFYVTQFGMLLGNEQEIWIDMDESSEDEILRTGLS